MKYAPLPQASVPPYPDNRIRTLPAGERPQERLEKLGAAALSDTELLAMLVRSGTRGQDVLTLSSKLISEAGSLAGLLAWHEADFRSVRGIGRVKALQLVAAMEVARRALRIPPNESPVDLCPRALESLACEVVQRVRANSSTTRVLINGDPGIALTCQADGVHLRRAHCRWRRYAPGGGVTAMAKL